MKITKTNLAAKATPSNFEFWILNCNNKLKQLSFAKAVINSDSEFGVVSRTFFGGVKISIKLKHFNLKYN